jgi:uncharacterized cupin superfamily protein
MSDRLSRHVNVFEATLEPYDLGLDEVVDGDPRTAELSVTSIGGVEVGIWEITEGAVRDVEKDEAFVVLAGDATVAFADGETLDLAPGSLVRLHAGESTVWTIRSTLRKVYVV